MRVIAVLLLLSVGLVAFIQALSPEGEAYVEEVKKLLGPDIVKELTAVRDDKSLDKDAKIAKLNDIMKKVPDSVLKSIPFPPRMRNLPAPILDKFRAIGVNKSLGIEEKIKQYHELVATLTPEQKKEIPTPEEIYQPI